MSLINSILIFVIFLYFIAMATSTRRDMIESKKIKNGFYLKMVRVYLALAAVSLSDLSFSVRDILFDDRLYQDGLILLRVVFMAVVVHAIYLALEGRDFRGLKGVLLDLRYLPGAVLTAFRPSGYKK